jgi:hypothetical protein
LVRRGAAAYESERADEELGAPADAARTAADRAGAAIDDSLAFIEASNARIPAMERAAARKAAARRAAR